MTNEAPAQKKGLSTLAWIAIGCGGLIVIAMIAVFGLGFFAVQKGKEMVADATGSESFQDFVDDMKENPAKKAAEAMVALNPDLELVSTDDEAGTITFLNRKTGEKATLDFEDIAEGRFSVTTDEGEYEVDAANQGEGGLTVTGPDGVTRYGASADLADVPDWAPMYPGASDAKSVMHSAVASSVTGLVTARTGDGARKVVDYYKGRFESAGWEIGSQSMSESGGAVYGSIVGRLDDRSVNVSVAQQDGECQISINYNGKP